MPVTRFSLLERKRLEDRACLVLHYALVPNTEPGAQVLSKDMSISGCVCPDTDCAMNWGVI